MFQSYKRFLICRRYEKDIWGYITVKHKTVNLGWIKVWPNVENVPHLSKQKRLLQDFSKRLSSTAFRALNFSFEIIWRMKKWKPKKMKNRMWFFFLTKILWIFYGNLRKQTFKNFCNICMAKKSDAIFFFIKFFEFRLPMFIYRMGLASSLIAATYWVTRGLIYVNNKAYTNPWSPIKLYDYVTFHPTLWTSIIFNVTKLFYYGSRAAWRWRCISSKIWSLERISRAHFISIPDYVYPDFKTFSFYWWKNALPSSIKYYFSLNISNILKYVTI